MSIPNSRFPVENLARLSLQQSDFIHYQTPPEKLVQQAVEMGEGTISDTGALVVETGSFTGRSPKDKFIVQDELTAGTVGWNEFNNPLEERFFDVIHKKALAYLEALPRIWIRDCYACADPRYRISIRVASEKPWTDLFAYNMFLRPMEEELQKFRPQWQVYALPGLRLDPAECGVRQGNASVVSFRHKMIIIAGSGYTGETKKGIFTVLNYILPLEQKVLSMHCSANMGAGGDTAVFFGLSGTGKTTLSADPDRRLIGDDEHGWSPDGIFNFEGGCYAKTIDLTAEKEPEIFRAIRPGALVENVRFFDGTNTINFSDAGITENTRVSYPLHFIPNAVEPPLGGLPRNIFFLTCDAFGVLPPLARLNGAQAMYHFISGYTAKIAGTETGITEPKPTFSACFGAPFLPLHPGFYARMLGELLQQQGVSVWLVNTGWVGGPYGTGSRIKLRYTRALLKAALEGALDGAAYETEPVFGLSVPKNCPGVPPELLLPRQSWPDPEAYDKQAQFLAGLFHDNFRKYAGKVSVEAASGAPAK